MKTTPLSKQLLTAILSGSYTPYDLREFVKLCSNLAFPLVRKKIVNGKLNLTILRMNDQDVLYDCLADLFERDERGRFVQIERFFEHEGIDFEQHSEEFLLDELRRIVFQKVNTGFIRLHSEADPVLGKILHNLDVAIDRTALFEKIVRFGESFLNPLGVDLLMHQPSMPFEYLQDRLFRAVLLHESMPAMLKKLHDTLLDQQDYQRSVSFVSVGLLLKDIYKLAQVSEDVTTAEGNDEETVRVQRLIDIVSRELHDAFVGRYVDKGKTTSDQLERYLAVVTRVLSEGVENGSSPISLFESLRVEYPNLTKESYIKQHRSILEYIMKDAKKRLKKKLSRSSA